MRVADFIVDALFNLGIHKAFVVTGRGSLFITDALAKSNTIKPFFLHHEQSAAIAANGVYQSKGEPSACIISTGCASTNTLTGLLCAWQDSIPTVFISGQNTMSETQRYTGLKIRSYGQQEADIIPIVSSITKYSVMLTEPNMVRYEIEKAFSIATSGRKGPVWIDVPLDIQNMRVAHPLKAYQIVPKKLKLKATDKKYLLSCFKKSERPAILIGSGVKAAGAKQLLHKFIEKFRLPLVYSSSAPDTYGSKKALSIGSLGSQGCSRAGAFVIQNSDLILVLGSRLNSLTTGQDFMKFGRESKIVVVDIDLLEHSKSSIEIDRLVNSDLLYCLENLIEEDIRPSWEPWISKCLHWKKIFKVPEKKIKGNERVDLYHLSDRFSDLLPESSTFICDSGFVDVIMPTNIDFGNNQTCIHPVSQGAMGYAIPAAIGANIAGNDEIFVVVGDGSIMMNIQELQTIAFHTFPIKLFVLNNHAYAIIRRRQNLLFRGRSIGTDESNGVSCPNFKAVAKSFGLKYFLIKKNKQVDLVIEEIKNFDGPVLCEVLGELDQNYIEVGFAKTKSKKIVRRPLEDQTPFLNRTLFLNEMLIDPIDQ